MTSDVTNEAASAPGAGNRGRESLAAPSAPPTLLRSLDELAARYDAILCDIWGVVHNGVWAFPAASEALRRYRAGGGRVVLLSNVPKPHDRIPAQLARLGVPRDTWDAIVTSGDTTRAALAARAPGPAHLIGTGEDAVIWEGLGLEFTSFERAAFLVVTGLDDFFHGKLEDYHERWRLARGRDLELVCANPDVVVRHGDRLHWCAGALARDYAALGGRVVMTGKPHAPIYTLASATLSRLAGHPVARDRVLVIGDGPTTDVLGANREGFDALFVAGGVQRDALATAAGLDASRVAAALAADGVHARYAIAELT